jgi:hypothetical protein
MRRQLGEFAAFPRDVTIAGPRADIAVVGTIGSIWQKYAACDWLGREDAI